MYEVTWCLILKLYNFEIKSMDYTSKCRIPVGARDFLFSKTSRPALGPIPSQLGTVIFPGDKAAGT